MAKQPEQPFDSIESAYDFFRILTEAVSDAKKDIDAQVQGETQRSSGAQSSRHLDALRVAYYSVEKLEFHANCSRRILNDLRSLRRLLFEERATAKATTTSQAVPTDRQAVPIPARLQSPVDQVRGESNSVVAA